MATTKKKVNSKLKWAMSWKDLFFAASLALNIAFVALLITLATTNALDGMWMREGLSRYCDSANDKKFDDNPEATKALRDFTCAKGDAAESFQGAFNTYLEKRAQ